MYIFVVVPLFDRLNDSMSRLKLKYQSGILEAFLQELRLFMSS